VIRTIFPSLSMKAMLRGSGILHPETVKVLRFEDEEHPFILARWSRPINPTASVQRLATSTRILSV